jgi:hypothetical protein
MHLFRLGMTCSLLLGSILVCRGETPGQISTQIPEQNPSATAVRRWTDSTGRFHMDGFLVGGDKSQVRLQKIHGSLIIVALSRLSTQDRQFVLNSLESPTANTDGGTPRTDRGTPRRADKILRQAAGPTQAASGAAPANTGAAPASTGAQPASVDPAGIQPPSWIGQLRAGWSSLSTPSLANAISIADVGPLLMQSSQPMPENLIYVRLSLPFLKRYTAHDVSESAPVNDYILGSQIGGVSQTVGSTEFILQPSDRAGLAELHFLGTNSYDSIADAGKVQVLTRGITRFASAKAIRIDGQGIHLGAAATNANSSSIITGIQTSLPRLRGRIALEIGSRRAAESLAEADAITADHTALQISKEFDDTAAGEIADLWKTIDAQFAVIPADHPLRRCGLQVSSTNDALQFVVVGPPGRNLPRVAPPTSLAADAEVEVQVHVALVKYLITNVGMQKMLQPVMDRFASMPASADSGRSKIHWSDDHRWLSIGWKSGDRPWAPSQSGSETLASRGH